MVEPRPWAAGNAYYGGGQAGSCTSFTNSLIEAEGRARVVKVITGEASWYARLLRQPHANGEVYKRGTMTAHRTSLWNEGARPNLWNGRTA